MVTYGPNSSSKYLPLSDKKKASTTFETFQKYKKMNISMLIATK